MKREPAVTTQQVGPLTLSAAIDPETADDEKRTVELIFSTGAPVERYDYWTGKRYVEKLSLDPRHVRLDRLNAGAPLLNAHSAYSVENVLGVVEPGSAEVSGSKATARVRFSERADVQPIWQDVRSGVLRNVSVGYRVHKFEETTSGKDNAIPVRTATDWEPFEVSMVPMGADPGARVRGERVDTNPCLIVRMEEDMPEEKTAAAATPEPAKTPAPTPAPAAPQQTRLDAVKDPAEVREEATATERKRADDIRMIVRTAKLEEKVADGFVKDGSSVDKVRAYVLEQLAARSAEHEPAPGRVVVGDDVQDKRRRGMTIAILSRAGVLDRVREAAKKFPSHPAFRDFRDEPGEPTEFKRSLLRLAEDDLERRGVGARRLDQRELAGMVLREIHTRGTASVVGAQTTSDFAVALENVLNKTLLAAYLLTPDTWRRFCTVGSLNDFRPHPRYRTGYLGTLDQVNEGGEFKNKNLPDAAKESITGATKGNIVALTRQTLINDDMGIFNRVATQVGRAAALSIETDVYALLALNAGLGPAMSDGDTLFHANHANIGAGAAISVAALDADAVVMGVQTDPNAVEILDIRPAVLLVPRGLEGTARVINSAEFDTDAGAPSQRPNRVRGMFSDIVGTGRMTGTRRYIFASPAEMPVIEVAFLDGVQDPFLDMQDGWRIDGVEWKCRIDYAVGAIEYRGAVTNAGA